jgi:hypothetical protein
MKRNKTKILIEALEHIVDPIGYTRTHLREGHVLNIPMAMLMDRDPNYFKSVAKEALNEYRKAS